MALSSGVILATLFAHSTHARTGQLATCTLIREGHVNTHTHPTLSSNTFIKRRNTDAARRWRARVETAVRRRREGETSTHHMRRTSSRDDLAHASLLPAVEASTPYVYMQAQTVMSPTTPSGPHFSRHCSGATVRILHDNSAGAGFTLHAFTLEITSENMTATSGNLPVFSLPLVCVTRARIEQASGANLHLWSLLCGCCFGAREQVLLLDISAPVGWLQRGPSGIAGPVRLGLFVRDAHEYVEAMELGDVLQR